jgi:hypothetical protein
VEGCGGAKNAVEEHLPITVVAGSRKVSVQML